MLLFAFYKILVTRLITSPSVDKLDFFWASICDLNIIYTVALQFIVFLSFFFSFSFFILFYFFFSCILVEFDVFFLMLIFDKNNNTRSNVYRDGCLQLCDFVAHYWIHYKKRKKRISCRNLSSIYTVSEMPCSVGIGIKHSFEEAVRQDDALDNTRRAMIRAVLLLSFSLTVSPLLTHRLNYLTNCKQVVK